MAASRRRGAHAAARADTALLGARRTAQRTAAGSPARDGATRGKRVNGHRFKPPLMRVVVAAMVVVVTAVGFTGLWSWSSAEPTVQAFLLDWQQGDYAAAATLTTGGRVQVAAELKGAYRGLGAASFDLAMGGIRQSGNTATARFQASVDLGQDGAPWVYTGHFSLRKAGGNWKINWSPSVICPGLRPGLHLAMASSTPARKPLLDAAGRPLQMPSTAFVAGVWPGRLRSPTETAQALGRVTGIEPGELLGWILAAPRASFQELVVFRPEQYSRLARQLRRVPGLEVRREKLRLFRSIAPAVVGSVGTEISSDLRNEGIAYRPGATVGMSGLQRAYQLDLAGTPTTKVIAENAAGHPVAVLKTWHGRTPTAVRTTLDSGAQQAANAVVAHTPGAAAVIAVQAPTGHILAVSRHSGHNQPSIDPLASRYQPGTAFTIVSTSALLESGLAVSAPIRCTRILPVGGRTFRNVPAEPNLGVPPFRVDFAHACGTAFSGLSQRLTAQELNNAAKSFGLGADWGLQLPSFSGAVHATSDIAQLASDTIGQGTVQASPLAMALVAAAVDAGTWHAPSLVERPGDPPVARQILLRAANLDTLRTLMRQTVRAGVAHAADLAGSPVYGQVGTVAVGTGKHHKWAHWFVGYRGGMAFAVLDITSSPSVASAVHLGARFLRLARTP